MMKTCNLIILCTCVHNYYKCFQSYIFMINCLLLKLASQFYYHVSMFTRAAYLYNYINLMAVSKKIYQAHVRIN